MFCVLFEVQPKRGQWDHYLAQARLLRPELQAIDGFVDNVRYRSLTRDGWVLSLSSWRDEKALVRWRTQPRHHAAQQKGRDEVFEDYHLRVGEVARDTCVPHGQALPRQRLDETQAGAGTTVVLIDATGAPKADPSPQARAAALGLSNGDGLVGHDVFEAVLTPGEFILTTTWRDAADAQAFEGSVAPPAEARIRRVRIVRDYGMFDRREAPQYYPDVARTAPGSTDPFPAASRQKWT